MFDKDIPILFEELGVGGGGWGVGSNTTSVTTGTLQDHTFKLALVNMYF